MSKTNSAPAEFSTEVREQYEDYPYPHRDIEKEGTFFSCCEPATLMGLSYSVWGGKRDLRHGSRILVAGCGTGDSTIHYAEEVVGCDTQIVAIDISSASIAIAKARMAKRGLSNVTFHHMSILDLPSAGLGQFDVIESSGVLHHLPDPNAGLAALAPMLKDDGVMSIMVYGQHGRYALYLIQALMKKLTTPEMSRAQKIEMVREFLKQVPASHWINVKNELFRQDMSWPDGSGMYDLFLHSTDRAYTVPELYEWVEGCGLMLEGLYSDLMDETIYAPETYNSSPHLHKIFAAKSPRERHAIAELMHGGMAKHMFFAAKQPITSAQFADDMVMSYGALQALFPNFIDNFLGALAKAPLGQMVQGNPRPFSGSPDLLITKTAHVEALMKHIDGKRSIGDMVVQVAKQSGAKPEDVRRDLEQLYHEYRRCQLVFLRHESIPPYRGGPEITKRVELQLKMK